MVSKERNILRTIKRRKAKWIGYMLRRNCLLKHIIERKIERVMEVTGRQGRRCKQLLYHFKETKEEALSCTVWRTRFRRSYGAVVKTENGINKRINLNATDVFSKALSK
jgi:hypothetical protein